MPPTRDRVSLNPGALKELRKAQLQVATSFGLDTMPTYTTLILAGARSLLVLADEFKDRPFASKDKLMVWSTLTKGTDLPEQVDHSISIREARSLLGVN